MRLSILLLLAACVSAERAVGLQQSSTGVLHGAHHRIVSPANWNGTLVLFLHGYTDRPATFVASSLPPGLSLSSSFVMGVFTPRRDIAPAGGPLPRLWKMSSACALTSAADSVPQNG